MRDKQRGFSLIELLIVVAIILIIAAIAIPNLLRSRMAANESSAVAALRTINTASMTYFISYATYPAGLASLGPSATPSSSAADLVDSVLAQDPASKTGYKFTYTGVGSPSTSYTVVAAPITSGVTGQRGFFTDQTGVIRGDISGSATSASTPLS
jgi:type IV pilus assembly protein PilA